MKIENFKKAVVKYWNAFLEVLFPSNLKCLFCNADIPDHDKQVYCSSCETTAPFNRGKRCKICDCEMEGDGDVCDGCLEYKKHFDKAVAPMKYEGPAKALILKLKNDNAAYLAPDMARLMSDRLNQESFSFDLIIPVPLSQKSLRKKIYLIITSFSRFLRIPVPYSSCNIPGKDLVTTNLSDQVSALLLFRNTV